MLQKALPGHIEGIGNEQQGERQDQQKHGEYLHDGFGIMRVAFEEDVHPDMLVMLQGIGKPQQEDHVEEVPLHFLQSDGAGTEEIAHPCIVRHQQSENENQNGCGETCIFGNSVKIIRESHLKSCHKKIYGIDNIITVPSHIIDFLSEYRRRQRDHLRYDRRHLPVPHFQYRLQTAHTVCRVTGQRNKQPRL